MIDRIELISNQTSYPFSTAEFMCRLTENGYLEQEYYMYGTSNLYERDKASNKAVKILADCPYVNRFILRAPADPAKCSGNIFVELINPSSGMEIERMWIDAYEKFMRDGDIYVGLTVKPNTLKSLKVYSEERYGRLEWPNPRKDVPFPFTDEEMRQYVFGMHMSHDFETGLCWDMITDLSHLLKSDSTENPLAAYKDKKIMLTGWSQDVSYIRTYVNYFANAMEKDIYDGYLLAGGVPALFVPMNQYEMLDPVDSTLGRVHSCKVPFMVVQTESDASSWGSYLGKKAGSDNPNFKYRLYEIAGGSHDTVFNLITYYAPDPELQRAAVTIEMPPMYNGTHAFANDYPYEYIWNAMYRNLAYWVRTGVAPREEELLKIDERGRMYRDGFGNSIGGIRTCLMDYPVAHFSSGEAINKNGEPFVRNSMEDFSAFGYVQPFSAALLKELYGDLATYRALCEEHTQIQVSKGFICKEDAQALVDKAVARAAEYGLA